MEFEYFMAGLLVGAVAGYVGMYLAVRMAK